MLWASVQPEIPPPTTIQSTSVAERGLKVGLVLGFVNAKACVYWDPRISANAGDENESFILLYVIN